MSEPIDCREAEARLQDYLKQELTPGARGRGARPPGPLPRLLRPRAVRGEAAPAAGGARPAGDLPRRLARADLAPCCAPRRSGAERRSLFAVAVAVGRRGGRAGAPGGNTHRIGRGGGMAGGNRWCLAGTGWEGGGVLAAFFVSSSLVSRGRAGSTAGSTPRATAATTGRSSPTAASPPSARSSGFAIPRSDSGC